MKREAKKKKEKKEKKSKKKKTNSGTMGRGRPFLEIFPGGRVLGGLLRLLVIEKRLNDERKRKKEGRQFLRFAEKEKQCFFSNVFLPFFRCAETPY